MWHLKSQIDEVENWAYIDKVFTKEECEKIIAFGNSLEQKKGTVVDGKEDKVRDSMVSWIVPSNESVWIFQRVTDAVVSLNNQFFKFDLDGFAEGFQFTKYEAPAGKYDLHIDKTYKSAIRKLSIVIQLSEPEDYEGGVLNIQASSTPQEIQKSQGFLAAFPSYMLHGVTPVTKGTRYSLVGWITGPAFK